MSNNDTIDTVPQFAAMFKALSNETRLRIFIHLASCCTPGGIDRCVSSDEIGATVGDVGACVDVVPSTVSHHIKELHTAGLISCRRRGQQIICCVNPAALAALCEFFEERSAV